LNLRVGSVWISVMCLPELLTIYRIRWINTVSTWVWS